MKYEGPLDYKKMSRLEKRAYETWANQRSRCNSKKDPSYKTYGARGIKVEYSSREFIGWYLREIKKVNMKRPSVGRVDHDKNYSLSNIKVEEFSDNSVESRSRYWAKTGLKPKTYTKVELFCICCGESIKVFESVKACASYVGITYTNLVRALNGNSSRFKSLLFKHVGARRLSKSRNNIVFEHRKGIH